MGNAGVGRLNKHKQFNKSVVTVCTEGWDNVFTESEMVLIQNSKL